MSVQPGSGPNDASENQEAQPSVASLAHSYAQRAGLKQHADGQVDLLGSAGGVQGIAESVLPGLVFLVIMTLNREMVPALIAALVVAAVFSLIRLLRRQKLTTALAGVVGVGISAFLALRTGNASDFYVPGFFLNAGLIVVFVITIAVRWPLAGLLFGMIRNEGFEWREKTQRLRAYTIATWLLVVVIALRLVVQLPLYFMGEDGLAALGTTRLVMGTPLYVLGLWVAWLLTRERPETQSETSGQAEQPASPQG